MSWQAFVSVFSDAAVPQKIVLAALAGAVPAALVAMVVALCAPTRADRWRRRIAELAGIGPALGLLTGAMTSFHMGRTIQRLPFDVTARQLAPGILEVSMLVGLGALVGVVALGAHWVLGRRTA